MGSTSAKSGARQGSMSSSRPERRGRAAPRAPTCGAIRAWPAAALLQRSESTKSTVRASRSGGADGRFQQLESGTCDVLVGSRFLGQGGYDVGILKRIGIGFFRIIIRMISGEHITDPTSGYQCLNRSVFTVFTEDNFPTDYPDANIIIMLLRKGYVLKEIPVAMVENPQGRSMHRGVVTKLYYFFKMFFSIFIVLIREK